MSIKLTLDDYPRSVLAAFIARRCLLSPEQWVELEQMRGDTEVQYQHRLAEALIDEQAALIGDMAKLPEYLALADRIDRAWAAADRARKRSDERVRAIRAGEVRYGALTLVSRGGSSV